MLQALASFETWIPDRAVILEDTSRGMTQILALQLYAVSDPGLRGRQLHYLRCEEVTAAVQASRATN